MTTNYLSDQSIQEREESRLTLMFLAPLMVIGNGEGSFKEDKQL